ncbi:MAG: poly(R)-hydroxyalkanoic acid synthase subunit PhaE [Bacteroidia bacterium]|nr:hypothetical protein [Bacteroidia bacterium]MDW8159507.1 poly(R)-hydroxyalkanoic acid synthase subunit PhaE [Bacteroidia bacterium]
MEKVQNPFTPFYEEWLNTQKTLINNWLNYFKLNAASNGNGSTIATDATPWKEWLDLQANIMQNYQKLFNSLVGEKSSAQLNEWIEMQNNLMNTFINASKQFLSVVGDSEKGLEFYKQFAQFQTTMMQTMLEQAKILTNANNLNKWAAADIFGLYDKWKEIFNATFNSLAQTYSVLGNFAQNEVVRDTIAKMMSSSTAYMKLFEFMGPLFRAIQQRTFTPENYQQYLDPANYKKIIDKVFEFYTPEHLQEFYDLILKVTSSYGAAIHKGVQRVNELIEKNASLLPDFVNGDPSVGMKMFENILHSYQKTFEPFYKIPVEGKNVEIIHRLTQITEKYSHYATLVTQYQYLMYKTGQDALDAVMYKISQMVKEGHEFKNFNEIFRIWVDTNEQLFLNLFNTEEFAKLQGELVETGLLIKGEFQKIMEIMLADYPVVPRSEVEELAKTVHDLDNKVHTLEKELETLRENKASSKKAVATKAE